MQTEGGQHCWASKSQAGELKAKPNPKPYINPKLTSKPMRLGSNPLEEMEGLDGDARSV